MEWDGPLKIYFHKDNHIPSANPRLRGFESIKKGFLCFLENIHGLLELVTDWNWSQIAAKKIPCCYRFLQTIRLFGNIQYLFAIFYEYSALRNIVQFSARQIIKAIIFVVMSVNGLYGG